MKNKGFTLIELLIVIAICGILIAVAVPHSDKLSGGGGGNTTGTTVTTNW